MKKHVFAMIVTIGLFSQVMVHASEPTETPTPTPVKGGCNLSTWNTAVYRYYGDRDSIIESVSTLPAEILERRVFIQVTQGESSTEIKLYERQTNGTFTVTQWSEKQTSDLLADIDRAIMANKGVNCVGEQVENVLYKELGKGRVSMDVAAPASPKAAFAHSVKEAKGLFIQTTVFVLC